MDFAALMREERARLRAAEDAGDGDRPEPEPAPAGGTAMETTAVSSPTAPTLPRLALATRAPLALEATRVGSHEPRDVFYAREFLDVAEESALLAMLSHPGWEWVQLRRRRLMQLGGSPRGDDGGLFERAPLPEFCTAVCATLVEAGVFPASAPPNHVLVNEYRVGEGLMPHRDGPAYAPTVAILSLGGPAALDFWQSAEQAARARDSPASPPLSVLCEPRSLVVFRGDAYERYHHGIAEREEDTVHPSTANAAVAGWPAGTVFRRGRRVSLTVRRVLAFADG